MNASSAVYLGVLLVSVLLLIAALISGFGHDADVAHEVDASHETGSDGGHVEADGPSWLSSRVILGAAAGFGAFGLGAQAVGMSSWATLPVALVGFLGMAIVIRQLVLRPMWRQQSNLLLSRDSYLTWLTRGERLIL